MHFLRRRQCRLHTGSQAGKQSLRIKLCHAYHWHANINVSHPRLVFITLLLRWVCVQFMGNLRSVMLEISALLSTRLAGITSFVVPSLFSLHLCFAILYIFSPDHFCFADSWQNSTAWQRTQLQTGFLWSTQRPPWLLSTAHPSLWLPSAKFRGVAPTWAKSQKSPFWFLSRYRTTEGTCNNLENPNWAMAMNGHHRYETHYSANIIKPDCCSNDSFVKELTMNESVLKGFCRRITPTASRLLAPPLPDALCQPLVPSLLMFTRWGSFYPTFYELTFWPILSYV